MSNFDFKKITTGTVDGTGVFDKIMATVALQLKSDAVKNKITGPEYATVYLGALQAAMELSVKFAIAEQESLITEQKLLLAKEELRAMEAKFSLIDKEKELIDAKIRDMDNSAQVKEATADKIEEEILLIKQRITSERAQTTGATANDGSVIGEQIRLYRAQADGYKADELQKAVKILSQIWVTQRSTDNAHRASPSGFGEDNTKKAVEKMLRDAGVVI